MVERRLQAAANPCLDDHSCTQASTGSERLERSGRRQLSPQSSAQPVRRRPTHRHAAESCRCGAAAESHVCMRCRSHWQPLLTSLRCFTLQVLIFVMRLFMVLLRSAKQLDYVSIESFKERQTTRFILSLRAAADGPDEIPVPLPHEVGAAMPDVDWID